ncbi:MAG: hypothetical protein V4487_04215 [Chlamydiota bacterium]
MKITIEYPQVMKMIMTSSIEVSDSSTLSDVKDRVLKSFWEIFQSIYPKSNIHGSKEDVILKDKEITISNDTELKERLGKTSSFQAVFREHLLTTKNKKEAHEVKK